MSCSFRDALVFCPTCRINRVREFIAWQRASPINCQALACREFLTFLLERGGKNKNEDSCLAHLTQFQERLEYLFDSA